MSGAPKLRSTNIANSEGRPVLRPATGINTASPTSERENGGAGRQVAKPSPKSTAKRIPSKTVNSSTSPDNNGPCGAKSPPLYSKSVPAATYEQLKAPSKNDASKVIGGGKAPKLNVSWDSACRPSLLKGGNNFSLSASCSSSSECSTDSFCSLRASKKAAALERYAQRKLRISTYGRSKSQSKPLKVVPDGVAASTPPEEARKRCGWITAQSDPIYIAFHDEEWGVPVHDDKKLFEFLILSSALQELSWPAILSKRETYREIFCGFDPVAVANFDERKIKSLKSNCNVMLYEGKLRGIVDNARSFIKIMEEFGLI